MEKIYTSPVRNYIQRNGFVMVSNLLIDYQQELGITESELAFIIKIMKNKSGFAIHDKDLDPTVCTKTLSRRRNSLKAKGYLNFSTIKEQDPNTGTFATKGISYDLSPLEEKLQMISDKIEAGREIQAKKVIQENNLIVESTEKSPIDLYKKEYKEIYGVDYNLTSYEIDKYNDLSESDKKIVAYIFAYCKDNNLFGKIVPRLSLFFKTKFRWEDLKKYCESNTLEEEQLNNDDIIKEIYLRYYEDLNDNYAFYKAVERIVNRYIKNGILPDGVDKILDKAYKDNYDFKKE